MFLEVLKSKVNELFNSNARTKNAEKEAYIEALGKYRQAEANFCYAEELYVEKAIYDLKSARLGLSNTLEVLRGERLGNKLAN